MNWFVGKSEVPIRLEGITMALAPPAKNGYEAKKGVVQIASYDYLAFITVEQYFDVRIIIDLLN